MTANKNTIKVFLIEPQKIVRQGIKVLLEEEPDLQVFTSQNKDVKISLLNHLKPDILFVSLDNLDENDFSYLNIFHELNNDSFQFSRLKIIIYANQVNQYILARSLQLGCDGYLLKESSIEELKQAIRSVYNGYKHIGNSVFGEIVKLTDNRLVETDNNFINSENNYAGLSASDGDLLSFEGFGVLEPEINKNFSSQNKTFHEKNVSEAVAFSPTENNDKKELLLKPSSNNLAVKLRQTGFKVLLIGIGYVTATSAILFLGDRRKEVVNPISQAGIVRAENIVVKSPYSGKIKHIAYRTGDMVEANQSIVQIEPDYVQRQKQALGQITDKIEQIKREINRERQLLATAKNKLEADKKQLELLDAENQPNFTQIDKLEREAKLAFENFQRLQKLQQKGVVSKSEVIGAEKAWKNLQNSNKYLLISPENNEGGKLKQLQIKLEQRQKRIDDKQKIIKYLNKNLAKANQRLNKIQNTLTQPQIIDIKAPSMGVVERVDRNTKEILNKGQTIVTLLDCHNLWVETVVDLQVLNKIKLDSSVLVKLEDYPNDIIGNISSVSSISKLERELEDEQTALQTNDVYRELVFQVIIDFSLPKITNQKQKFCGIGETALVIFNN